MTLTAPPRRTPPPTLTARRVGYAAAVLVNAALWYAVNTWPGWGSVPFLTDETDLVLGMVNASIAANLLANLVYLARDPQWLRALGGVLTTTVSMVALVKIWQVFPFDFSGSSFDWSLVTRVLLCLGIGGSALGILTGFDALVRGRDPSRRGQ